VGIQDLFSVDEARNKAMKIERLQSRVLPFKGAAERTSDNTRAQQGSTSSGRPPPRMAIDAPLANPTRTTAPIAKGKENPYAKQGVGKCYKCGEPGHRPSE